MPRRHGLRRQTIRIFQTLPQILRTGLGPKASCPSSQRLALARADAAHCHRAPQQFTQRNHVTGREHPPPTPLARTTPALPQASDAIAGVPAISASDTTAPQPSCQLGSTSTSARAMQARAASIGRLPIHFRRTHPKNYVSRYQNSSHLSFWRKMKWLNRSHCAIFR